VPRRLLHAKTVRKWFADNRIQLLENWPSNSPDLNAIESCWNIMKKKSGSTSANLRKGLERCHQTRLGNEITSEYCKSWFTACHLESMLY
jgi:transposase